MESQDSESAGAASPEDVPAGLITDSAGRDLFPEIYGELRALANVWFRSQPSNHTLQPTALVHEAFLRLSKGEPGKVYDRTHLLATVARAMRQILIDHARRRGASKRGGNLARVQLDSVALATEDQQLDFEVLHEALRELEKLNPRQADIVELRFFGGLTIEETSEVLGVAPRTVRHDWQFARAWLLHRIKGSSSR
ncbi:MAG: ECF-type sigma factor [Planctomycetota bacterium]